MKYEQLENKAEKALLTCLADVPFLSIKKVEKMPLNDWADMRVKLKLPDGDLFLIVEVKSNGQPRLVRDAINQLLRYKNALPNSYPVLIAPYISPQSAEICVNEGVGYIDLAGNSRLSFGQVYIYKEGKANPFNHKRDLRSLYSPKATRVLRVLLSNPGREWKMQALAEESEVSLGQVANVKSLLADREWLSFNMNGLLLNKPKQLLFEWAENYDFRRNQVHDFYSLKSVSEIEYELARICDMKNIQYVYVLTGFSGAARMAPSVRYQRVTAYVQQEAIENLALQMNLKKVSSGANVSLLVPYDDGVFYGAKNYDWVKVATPVQVYLDLREIRGRGEEAASVLLEEVIKSQW
ncbi:type IV toxin-antitoxin system AbiEi family antitoxin [Pelotomaculum schinkii]|nr:type IV toxin-antitoxin system AbiEi family antitoxin [Pelotomaculum schinkii]